MELLVALSKMGGKNNNYKDAAAEGNEHIQFR